MNSSHPSSPWLCWPEVHLVLYCELHQRTPIPRRESWLTASWPSIRPELCGRAMQRDPLSFSCQWLLITFGNRNTDVHVVCTNDLKKFVGSGTLHWGVIHLSGCSREPSMGWIFQAEVLGYSACLPLWQEVTGKSMHGDKEKCSDSDRNTLRIEQYVALREWVQEPYGADVSSALSWILECPWANFCPSLGFCSFPSKAGGDGVTCGRT